MKKIAREIMTIRAMLLLLNFVINLYLAHTIIHDLGQDFFAFYSILIALPALIPFADLGLGTGIFNLYVDSNPSNLPRDKITRIFWTLILASGAQFVILSLLIYFFFDIFFPNNAEMAETKLFAVLILLITYFAVPLSLAAKKLQAESRNQIVVIFQGLIPLLNIFSYFIVRFLFPDSASLIVLIPSCSYLITTVLIYKLSQLHKDMDLRHLHIPKNALRHDLDFGFWVLAFSGLMTLGWQFPKFYFSYHGNSALVANYSIFLMIGLATFSIFQLPGISLSPIVRKNPESSSSLLKTQIVQTLKISFFLSIVILLFFKFGNFAKYLFLGPNFVFLLAFIVAVSPVWQIPINTFSHQFQFRVGTIYLLIYLGITFLFFSFERFANLNSLIIYIFVFIALLSTISFKLQSRSHYVPKRVVES